MNNTYKAVEVSAPGKLRVVERPIPNPGPGQVRIRVEACGICHTDSHTVNADLPRVTLPRVPGHEVVGRGTAAAGAKVTFKMTKAGGSTVTQTATADSTGTATWTYRIGQKDPKGTWSTSAKATLSSQTASSSIVSFTVQ